MADKYILVRVTENHPDSRRTDVATIRRSIHDALNHYSLDAGDMVLTEDPNYVQSVGAGSTAQAKADWKTVNEIFSRTIANSKAAVEKRIQQEAENG